MCISVHVYLYIWVCVYMDICVCLQAYVCVNLNYVNECDVSLWIRMYGVSICTCIHVSVYMCMCSDIYLGVSVHAQHIRCMCVYVTADEYLSLCMYNCVCLCACVPACFVCIHVYTCVYVHRGRRYVHVGVCMRGCVWPGPLGVMPTRKELVAPSAPSCALLPTYTLLCWRPGTEQRRNRASPPSEEDMAPFTMRPGLGGGPVSAPHWPGHNPPLSGRPPPPSPWGPGQRRLHPSLSQLACLCGGDPQSAHREKHLAQRLTWVRATDGGSWSHRTHDSRGCDCGHVPRPQR